jgi:hypothetical protein
MVQRRHYLTVVKVQRKGPNQKNAVNLCHNMKLAIETYYRPMLAPPNPYLYAHNVYYVKLRMDTYRLDIKDSTLLGFPDRGF